MIAALLLAAQAAADPALLARGAEVYKTTCAVAYCHGPEGTAGRAPAIAGRTYNKAALRRIIANGIPSRGMPAFGSLGNAAIDALVDYVISLPAPQTPPPDTPGSRAVKPDAAVAAGRDLFFDSTRMPSCGDCHRVQDMGGAVGPPLSKPVIRDVTALRRVRVAKVFTAQPAGESPFPALVIYHGPDVIRLFDLGAPLPVLRTLAAPDVTLNKDSKWTHASMVHRYSNQELELILGYYRWAASH